IPRYELQLAPSCFTTNHTNRHVSPSVLFRQRLSSYGHAAHTTRRYFIRRRRASHSGGTAAHHIAHAGVTACNDPAFLARRECRNGLLLPRRSAQHLNRQARLIAENQRFLAGGHSLADRNAHEEQAPSGISRSSASPASPVTRSRTSPARAISPSAPAIPIAIQQPRGRRRGSGVGSGLAGGASSR